MAIRMGWRDWRRNPVLWLLLVAVPAVFILLAQAITPHRPTDIVVVDNGVRAARTFDVYDLHAGTMAPIAVAALATRPACSSCSTPARVTAAPPWRDYAPAWCWRPG
jgi:hypothetical protein